MSNENESIELKSLLDLPVSPLNPLKKLGDYGGQAEIERLCSSLEREGQIEPFWIHRDSERGTEERLTGNMRVLAYSHGIGSGVFVGQKKVRVEYFSGTLEEARFILLADDLVRQHRSPTQRVMACLRLRRVPRSGRKGKAEKGLSIRELARFCGVSKATVERAVALEKCPMLLNAVVNGDKALTVALKELKEPKSSSPSPSPSPNREKDEDGTESTPKQKQRFISLQVPSKGKGREWIEQKFSSELKELKETQIKELIGYLADML